MSFRINFYNTYHPVTTFYKDIIPSLNERGIETRIVCSRATYRDNREQLPPHSLSSEQRIFSLFHKGNSPAKKGLISLFYLIGSIPAFALSKKPNLNVFLTQPPLAALLGLLFKKCFGVPYVCVVMDIYPDVAIQLGLLKKTALITRTFTYLQKLSLRNATQVIAIGECMKRQLANKGIQSDRISIIPNWANNKTINNKSNKCPIPNLKEKFVVLYSGNIGASHYFDDILKVSLELKELDNYHFLFIGTGSRRSEIVAFIEAHKPSNLTLLDPVPENELNEYLNLANVHFVSLRNTFSGLVVPSKTYGALATGKPVIFQGPLDSEIAKLLHRSQAGLTILEGDAEDLKDCILKYGNNSDLLSQHSDSARKAIDTYYNQEKAFEQYWKVFHQFDPSCTNQQS